jgi:hypothetical protein
MTADHGAGRARRRAGLVAGPVALAAVTAGVVLARPALRPGQPAAAPAATGTAPVVRTDLTDTVQVSGALGYAGSYTIVNQEAGTAFTAVPAPGATVRRGQAIYEVDGAPVSLFYGARPAWRPLYQGVAGPDVAQLDRNLIALGYGDGLAVSRYFTVATAYAVERWQAARGLPVTGTVPLGQVAYAPGPLRVTAVTAVPGAPPQPGTSVLTATSTAPVVLAQVPVDQEYLVRAGDAVSVTLPDGSTTTPGVIAAVSPVASAASAGGQGGSAAGGANSQPGDQVATVRVTVRLVHPSAAGHLDQAPVTVSIVSAHVSGVLAVPVSALVALAGGGYAVEVVTGPHRHLIAVQTGLFAQTRVQVSAPGLTAGQRVEVPSS